MAYSEEELAFPVAVTMPVSDWIQVSASLMLRARLLGDPSGLRIHDQLIAVQVAEALTRASDEPGAG